MSSIKTQHIALGVALAVTVVVAVTLLQKKKQGSTKRKRDSVKCEAPPTPIPKEENRLDSGIASPKDTPTTENRSLSKQNEFVDQDESFRALYQYANGMDTSSMFVETSVVSGEERALEFGDIVEKAESKEVSSIQPESRDVSFSQPDVEVEDSVIVQAVKEEIVSIQPEPEEICEISIQPELNASLESIPEPVAQEQEIIKEPEVVQTTLDEDVALKNSLNLAMSPEGDNKPKRNSVRRESEKRDQVDAESPKKPATPSTRRKSKSKEKDEIVQTSGVEDHKNNNNIEAPNSENAQAGSTSDEASRRNSTESAGVNGESLKSDTTNDSGKGFIENGVLPRVPYKHEFELPQSLCGRLIGKSGATVQSIKRDTGATVTVRSDSANPLMRVVYVVGKEEDVKKALEVIKRKFPRKMYPDLSFEGIKPAEHSIRYYSLSTENDNMVMITAIESADHMFFRVLSPAMNAAFANLQLQLKAAFYGPRAADFVPLQAANAVKGAVCVAIEDDDCFRAEIVSFDEIEEQVRLKFLDHGGYDSRPLSCCKMIRNDMLFEPFHAIEAVLANVVPVGREWSDEAMLITSTFAQSPGTMFARVLAIAKNKYHVSLYRFDGEQSFNLAEELVAANEARWLQPNSLPVKSERIAPSFTPQDFPVLSSPDSTC